MIKAIKNGIAGIFSDTDWKSGQPQRYGWQEEGKEGKTLPIEIIKFIERRKVPPEPVKDEPTIQIVKENKKKNDNPKQKVRGAAKRNPKRVAKA
jgi:hypothetical protein